MQSESRASEVRAFLIERLDIMLQGCEQVMNNAGYGQAVHDLDDFLTIEGQKLLQEVYQQKLQEHIERTESTSESKQCPSCKKKSEQKTDTPKN